MEDFPRMSLRQKHVQQLMKTEMCKFFLANRCRKGDRCDFAHSLSEIREKPDLNCTSMCKQFLQTGTCANPYCSFAHDERELRTTAGFFKTKLCKFAASGRCKHGTSCRFAHSPEEVACGVESGAAIATQMADITGTYQPVATAPKRVSGCWVPPEGSEAAGMPLGNVRFESSSLESQGQASSDSGEAFDHSTPDLTTMAASDQNGHEVGSDQSTRAETSASLPTPNGSGESGQEEPHGSGSGSRQTRSRGDQRCLQRPTGERGRHCTTMMLTNVPNFLTQGALVSLLEDLTVCMRGAFDFFYCPWDPYQDRNLGYAIINFFTRAAAAEFERQWVNQPLLPRSHGAKRLRIMPAALQGRAAHLRHFSGFSLAHHKDPRFRPLVRAAPDEPLQPMATSEELMRNAENFRQQQQQQQLMPYPKEAARPQTRQHQGLQQAQQQQQQAHGQPQRQPQTQQRRRQQERQPQTHQLQTPQMQRYSDGHLSQALQPGRQIQETEFSLWQQLQQESALQQQSSQQQQSSACGSCQWNGAGSGCQDGVRGSVPYMFYQPGLAEAEHAAMGMQGVPNTPDDKLLQQCWALLLTPNGSAINVGNAGTGHGSSDGLDGSGITPVPYYCNQQAGGSPHLGAGMPLNTEAVAEQHDGFSK